MSFCVTHRSALDKNIRHLYSGRPSNMQLRSHSNNQSGALDVLDRVLEKQKRPPERFERKFQEYNPEYNTHLPRAPAFRSVSPEEAKQISARLSRPTVTSALRRQENARRCTSSSTYRRGRSQMSISDEGGSEQQEEGEEPNSSPRRPGHRRVSYKDWSDNESGVYYEDYDEYDNSKTSETSKDDDEDFSTNKEDHDWRYREEPSSESQYQTSESCDLTQETQRSDSINDTRDDGDKSSTIATCDNDNDSKSEGSKATTRNEAYPKRPVHKRKMNILEQIMQSRNTRYQHPKTKPQEGTRNTKPMYRRQPLNNGLVYSPYREPMPRLYIVYNPPVRTKSTNQKIRGDQLSKSYNTDGRQAKSAGSTKTQKRNQSFLQRPQTTAASTRRKEVITYQYRPESRATLSDSPKRSKSAPPPAMCPETKSGRTHTTSSTAKQPTTTRKTTSATAHGGQKNTVPHQTGRANKMSPRDSNLDSDEPSLKKNRRSANRNDKENAMKAKEHRKVLNQYEMHNLAGHRHMSRASYEAFYSMYAGHLYGEQKRYASPAEMRKANTRLMKPTTAKAIRDRMRYAPNNNRDLADPVKVVQEAVQGSDRRRDRRGGLEGGDDYEDSAEEEGDDDVNVTTNKDKNLITTNVSGNKERNETNEKDDEKGLRGRRDEEHLTKKTRPVSRSSTSSAECEKSQARSRSRSRSSSRSSRPSHSRSGSHSSSKSRSRSRSGSRSSARSESHSIAHRGKSPQSGNLGHGDLEIDNKDQMSSSDGKENDVSRGSDSRKASLSQDSAAEDHQEYSVVENSENSRVTHAVETQANEATDLSDDAVKGILKDYDSGEIKRKASETDRCEYEYSTSGFNHSGRGGEYQDTYGRGDDEKTSGSRYTTVSSRGDTAQNNTSSHSAQDSLTSPPPATYSVNKYYATEDQNMNSSYEDATYTDADETIFTEAEETTYTEADQSFYSRTSQSEDVSPRAQKDQNSSQSEARTNSSAADSQTAPNKTQINLDATWSEHD